MRQSEDARPHVPAGSRKKPRWPRRTLWIIVACACSLMLVSAGTFLYATNHYAGSVERIPDVFSGLDQADRPPDAAIHATTFLLIGTDTPTNEPTAGTDTRASTVANGSRSDAIMLVQIADGGAHASVISIPRDSWVPIPGHGEDKINAAYAFGGPPLLIHTVESLTGVRIDHFAAIDFEGFKSITDTLGGVTVYVAAETESGGVTFHPGPNRLDGDSALIYVRQRHGLPGGDFDREQRQQNFLRAVLTEVRTRGLLSSPARSDKIIRAFTAAISVDNSLSNEDLLAMARQLSKLSSDDVDFLTAPVAGTGWEGQQSVVRVDQPTLHTMMSQLRAGTLPQHAAQYKTLPATPN